MNKENLNRIRFRFVAQVSERKLVEIWSLKFSDKKFPKVRAFILEDPAFDVLLECLGRVPTIKDTQLKEYGRVYPNEQVMAFAFPGTTDDAIIVVRENSLFSLDRDLEHELRHIYLGQHKVW
jgi:hypothetical protein